jgi:hypothetical protein
MSQFTTNILQEIKEIESKIVKTETYIENTKEQLTPVTSLINAFKLTDGYKQYCKNLETEKHINNKIKKEKSKIKDWSKEIKVLKDKHDTITLTIQYLEKFGIWNMLNNEEKNDVLTRFLVNTYIDETYKNYITIFCNKVKTKHKNELLECSTEYKNNMHLMQLNCLSNIPISHRMYDDRQLHFTDTKKIYEYIKHCEKEKYDKLKEVCEKYDVNIDHYIKLFEVCNHNALDALLYMSEVKKNTVDFLIFHNLWYKHTNNDSRVRILFTEKKYTFSLEKGILRGDRDYWGNELHSLIMMLRYKYTHTVNIRNVENIHPTFEKAWNEVWDYEKTILSMIDIDLDKIASKDLNEVRGIIINEFKNDTFESENSVCNEYLHLLNSMKLKEITQYLLTSQNNFFTVRPLYNTGFVPLCEDVDQFLKIQKIIGYDVSEISNSIERRLTCKHYLYPYSLNDKSDIDVIYKHCENNRTKIRYFKTLKQLYIKNVEIRKEYIDKREHLRECLDNANNGYFYKEFTNIIFQYCEYDIPDEIVYDKENYDLHKYLIGEIDDTVMEKIVGIVF